MLTTTESRTIARELVKIIKPVIQEAIRENIEQAYDKMFTTQEAAAYLNCKVQTVYNNISTIPHFKMGRKLLFRKSALDDYIERRSVLQNA